MVILVDDNIYQVKTLAGIFESHGERVYCFEDPLKFITFAKSVKVDLFDKSVILVIDLRMPKMNGIELVNELKDLGIFYRVTIVLCTGEAPKNLYPLLRETFSNEDRHIMIANLLTKPVNKGSVAAMMIRTKASRGQS